MILHSSLRSDSVGGLPTQAACSSSPHDLQLWTGAIASELRKQSVEHDARSAKKLQQEFEWVFNGFTFV